MLFSVLFVNHFLLFYVMALACAIIIVSTAWDKKFHGQAHLGTRKMLKYHNASRLQAIFGRASIAKSSPERCYACGFAQSVQPNLTQIRARSRYINIFRVHYSLTWKTIPF